MQRLWMLKFLGYPWMQSTRFPWARNRTRDIIYIIVHSFAIKRICTFEEEKECITHSLRVRSKSASRMCVSNTNSLWFSIDSLMHLRLGSFNWYQVWIGWQSPVKSRLFKRINDSERLETTFRRGVFCIFITLIMRL